MAGSDPRSCRRRFISRTASGNGSSRNHASKERTEMAALTYAKAGVDRDAADKLVEKITTLARTTLNKRVRSSIGGYASLYELDKKRWLAASTDGVGTKLKLAFRLKEHRTVGI